VPNVFQNIGNDGFFFAFFVPGVDAQRNQNPNDHEDDFANGVFEVLGGFAFYEKVLADVSEEFNHASICCFVPLGTLSR
jgi:peptidoglycan biosynthesis protein MviN/MurJ (putative lipid II flippase)